MSKATLVGSVAPDTAQDAPAKPNRPLEKSGVSPESCPPLKPNLHLPRHRFSAALGLSFNWFWVGGAVLGGGR